MSLLFTFLKPIYNDAPEPWQIGFQDGASPGFEGITELHDSIFFFLVIISVGVFWALGSVMINFNSTSSPAERFGKTLAWVKLSNSGDALKLLIPSCS